jgi:hypothetical protein
MPTVAAVPLRRLSQDFSSPEAKDLFLAIRQPCNNDAMLGSAAHLPEAYSPKCLEGASPLKKSL